MPRGKARRTLELIEAAFTILDEIQPATVRAVCYRLFTRRLIPNMEKTHTNRVSRVLVEARETGVIPWDWIVDETRAPERVATWADPEGILRAVEQQYRKDRWMLQARRVEIWSEKGTVRGTLSPVLTAYAVTFRVLHGFASATVVQQAAVESRADARPLVAFYVGDWDPSGLYMSEVDLPRRLAEYGGAIDLRRVALDPSDIMDPDLPAFRAAEKTADTRHGWYTARYGRAAKCWEVDALDPRTLRTRAEEAIRAEIEWPAWQRGERAEDAERDSLRQVLGRWRDSISGQASE